MRILTNRFCMLVFCGALHLVAAPTLAESLDIETMIASIDARAVQYGRLTDILQGTDPVRALAAFDVMLEADDKTLRETAISAAMASTDERLRARALWETLARKDSFTIEIMTEGLEKDARAALDSWIGRVSSWSIVNRLPETQCLNLENSKGCYAAYHVSVAGTKIEMISSQSKRHIHGGFSLNSEGILVGKVSNPNDRSVYPATIQIR